MKGLIIILSVIAFLAGIAYCNRSDAQTKPAPSTTTTVPYPYPVDRYGRPAEPLAWPPWYTPPVARPAATCLAVGDVTFCN